MDIKKTKKRQRLFLLIVIVLCVALVMGALLFDLGHLAPENLEDSKLPRALFYHLPDIEGITKNSDSYDHGDSGHQRIIVDERYASYKSRRVIGEEYVGKYMETLEVYTYYRDRMGEDTHIEYLTAELYQIQGVDTRIAFCLKYLDPCEFLTTTHYYTFMNPDVTIESLSELWEIYRADSMLTLSWDWVVAYERDGEYSDIKSYTVSKEEASRLCAGLLSVDGSIVELTEENYQTAMASCKKMARYYTALLSAGDAANVWVMDSGYLIWDSSWDHTLFFFIGKEKAKMLIENVESCTEKITSVGSAETIVKTTSR